MEEIRKEGHISTCIRKAIALGVPVAKAYKMGSYQAAEFYGLKNYGAIGAGYRADIVFLDDMRKIIPFRFRMSCFIPFMWERSPKRKSGFPVMEKRM